jgi:hypothetical protein
MKTSIKNFIDQNITLIGIATVIAVATVFVAQLTNF